MEYRNEFNELRLTLPGRYERLGGPGWRFERLAYRAGDTYVEVFVDSVDRSSEKVDCGADCTRVKELRTCTDEIDGHRTRIEASLVISPEHFPPRHALYVIDARLQLREGVLLRFQSVTRDENTQLELLAALRHIQVPIEFP